VEKKALCTEDEPSFVSEPCYIDNNIVLLYKIINWWNDTLPDDDSSLCGSMIKCQSNNNIKIEYNKKTKKLTLANTGYFGDLLSVFRECENCPGPSYFKCVWLNKRYFDGIKISTIPRIVRKINIIQFSNISKQQAKLMFTLEGKIKFLVEGKIRGLLLENGKIALHHGGKFSKTCPTPLHDQVGNLSISLVIMNFQTGEPIARYSAVFEK
jgi:hypothetical protein